MGRPKKVRQLGGIAYKEHYEQLKSARFDVKTQQAHGGGQTGFKAGMSIKSIVKLVENRAFNEGMNVDAAMALANASVSRYNDTIENGVKAITTTETYKRVKDNLQEQVNEGWISKDDMTRRLYQMRENAKQEREAAKATLLWMAFGDIEGIKNILDMDMNKIRSMFDSLEFQELVLRVNRATSQWRAKGGNRERIK